MLAVEYNAGIDKAFREVALANRGGRFSLEVDDLVSDCWVEWSTAGSQKSVAAVIANRPDDPSAAAGYARGLAKNVIQRAAGKIADRSAPDVFVPITAPEVRALLAWFFEWERSGQLPAARSGPEFEFKPGRLTALFGELQVAFAPLDEERRKLLEGAYGRIEVRRSRADLAAERDEKSSDSNSRLQRAVAGVTKRINVKRGQTNAAYQGPGVGLVQPGAYSGAGSDG